MNKMPVFNCKVSIVGFGLLILTVSYFTYFQGYDQPAAFFWDENYHVTHAQKYLNGIFHMHEHPPLGKLLIALGEKIFDANQIDNQFIGTDYIAALPAEFSFTGYRFFSALLSWFTAPVFFLILLVVTRHPLWSALLSCFYVFDNALIVHGRGAMLDGPLIFFVSTSILAFLLIHEWRYSRFRFGLSSFLFGVFFACAVTTKLVGLILLLLIPAILMRLPGMREGVRFLLFCGTGFVLTFFMVWQAHFSLGVSIHPDLRNNGYYEASENYRALIETGVHTKIKVFPNAIVDSLKYPFEYDRGIPDLNLCKPDENGSPVWFWPFGGRSITYRWETPDGENFKYLQLISNPVSWILGTAAAFLGLSLLAISFFFGIGKKDRNLFLIATFSALYFAFMLVLGQMSRVLFLYHYFPPLLFSFILFSLCFVRVTNLGPLQLGGTRKTIGAVAICAGVILAYSFFSPLTYFKPLTDLQFQKRALLDIWELRCARCPRHSWIATPRGSGEKFSKP